VRALGPPGDKVSHIPNWSALACASQLSQFTAQISCSPDNPFNSTVAVNEVRYTVGPVQSLGGASCPNLTAPNAERRASSPRIHLVHVLLWF